MIVEEGLELVEQVLVPGQLNKVQKIVFQQAWAGRSYKEIAEQFGYTLGYIKDTGSALWQLLSEALGEKVTRQNFQAVLKRTRRQTEQSFRERWSKRDEAVETSKENLTQSLIEKPTIILDSCTPSLPQCDWGEAIDVSVFYNRHHELAMLERWIGDDHCRLVAIGGMGGIGKTALSVKLAEQIQGKFEFLIWRSLRYAPTLQDLLADVIPFLSNQQQVKLPESIDSQISYLMKYLRQHRCLLVLDNVESILKSGDHTGRYRQGYEAYRQLIARISDEPHQSCLVLTSREKPGEILIREGDSLPVRSLQLVGLQPPEGQKLLHAKGLVESEADCRQLIDRYSGNPLALKIAATTIRSLFNSNIGAFLAQGMIVFGDISELLDQQFNRLSILEQQVMYWLAIAREPMTLEELQEDIVPQVSQRELLEALASLQRRSLIEKAAPTLSDTSAVGFSQQPVVMEYMTERLVKQFYYDAASYELDFFNHYALLKAQSKEYIRDTQIHLILQPVKDKLLAAFGTQQNLEAHLNHLLATLRNQPSRPGYAAGNLLNLFCSLHSDMCDRN